MEKTSYNVICGTSLTLPAKSWMIMMITSICSTCIEGFFSGRPTLSIEDDSYEREPSGGTTVPSER